jgi:hypothetical protein
MPDCGVEEEGLRGDFLPTGDCFLFAAETCGKWEEKYVIRCYKRL